MYEWQCPTMSSNFHLCISSCTGQISELCASTCPETPPPSVSSAGFGRWHITNACKPPEPSFDLPSSRGLKWGMPEDREVTKTVTQGISGLEEIEDEGQDYIAIDVLRWQWIRGQAQLAWVPSPVMLDRSIAFHLPCHDPHLQ